MIDKSIRHKRKELREKSLSLQGLYLESDNSSKFKELRKNQDETYKKYQFYNNLIKHMEKLN